MQRTKVGKLNGLSLLLDAEIFDYVYPDEVNMILKDFINTSLLSRATEKDLRFLFTIHKIVQQLDFRLAKHDYKILFKIID